MSQSRLHDGSGGYGWLSIALHWLAASAVLTLWVVGSSIPRGGDGNYRSMLELHTSIAICVYLLLWGRIAFRLAKGHPPRSPRQSPMYFAAGVLVHFALLLAMAAMLVSGPLMVWAGGNAIHVFQWFVLSSPFEPNATLFQVMHAVHACAGTVLICGTLLHVVGVFKHVAFNRDETLDRMMVAREVALTDESRR